MTRRESQTVKIFARTAKFIYMTDEESRALYDRALSVMPGGVNSSVRATQPYPFLLSVVTEPPLSTLTGPAILTM